MNRRSFLGLLVATGITTAAGVPIAPRTITPAPPPPPPVPRNPLFAGEVGRYEGITFRRIVEECDFGHRVQLGLVATVAGETYRSGALFPGDAWRDLDAGQKSELWSLMERGMTKLMQGGMPGDRAARIQSA